MDVYKTYTLNDFISTGISDTTIQYGDLCLTEKNGKIRYTVKMILDDYLYELEEMALKVKLSSDEFMKYQYNPKLLAFDIYKSAELYPYILMINEMTSVREFDKKIILLNTNSDLLSSLSTIYAKENRDIKKFNNNH